MTIYIGIDVAKRFHFLLQYELGGGQTWSGCAFDSLMGGSEQGCRPCFAAYSSHFSSEVKLQPTPFDQTAVIR